MKLRMPTYCKSFKCTADKCRDNCCIGWEIDIDPSSAEYYKTVGGDFGNRLKENITSGDVCSFKMKGERCAFLNENNLCDIIINLGENALCQICRDHPRYFEWYSAVKEGGVGLCCEAAAKLILTQTEKFSVFETDCDDEGEDDYSPELYDYFLFARQQIISMLENEELPLSVRLSSVLSFAHKVQENADNYCFIKENITVSDSSLNIDMKNIARSFLELEIMDESWREYRQKLYDNIEQTQKLIDASSAHAEAVSRYLQNIAVYFIWRYFMKGVFTEEIFSYVFLCAVSVLYIERMFILSYLDGKKLTADTCSILAKNYSKEIEYSFSNLQTICEMAYPGQ